MVLDNCTVLDSGSNYSVMNGAVQKFGKEEIGVQILQYKVENNHNPYLYERKPGSKELKISGLNESTEQANI